MTGQSLCWLSFQLIHGFQEPNTLQCRNSNLWHKMLETQSKFYKSTACHCLYLETYISGTYYSFHSLHKSKFSHSISMKSSPDSSFIFSAQIAFDGDILTLTSLILLSVSTSSLNSSIPDSIPFCDN